MFGSWQSLAKKNYLNYMRITHKEWGEKTTISITKIVYLTNRNLHFLNECKISIEKSYFWQNYKVKVKSQHFVVKYNS